jgi:hypothetical protein
VSSCDSRAPRYPTPEGMPLDVVAGSPRHRHLLTPSAPCELEAGHAGPHRNGLLVWHAPPIVVGRELDVDAPVHFSWEVESG